jgi:PBP1b-binding outer membrane lipoprotein LpoB
MMKKVYLITALLLINGCSGYTFEPINTPPKTEHEAMVKEQQNALTQQQEMILNN